VAIAVAAGCTGAEPDASRDAASEERRSITRAFFDALSRSDVEAVDALYAEDFVLWSPGSLPFSGTHDKAEALELTKMIAAAFPQGLRFTIDAMTVEGERVAVEAHSEGRHASGRDYRNQYHFLVKIRDGKIVMLKEYMDTQHAMDVLLQGVPAPGSGG
jgi:ketosteroid isomerase-like protein